MLGVIIPKDTPEEEIDSLVNELMEPFDENLQVPAYEEDCFCVGIQAVKAVRSAADEAYGTWSDIQDRYRKEVLIPEAEKLGVSLPDLDEEIMNKTSIGNRLQKLWEDDYCLPRGRFEQSTAETHPLKDKPDPDCQDCHGSGIRTTTYNPNSKWDCWSYGGRWNGEIAGKPENDSSGFNFGDEYRQFESNIARVSDFIATGKVPFALLTPDVKWYERGEMGWFGNVKDEKDEWEDQAMSILKQYPEDKIVGIDCHI